MKRNTTGFLAILLGSTLFFNACSSSQLDKIEGSNKTYQPTVVKSDDVVLKVNGTENVDRFSQFYNHLQHHQADQVRIVTYTDEGDPIFTNVVFDGATLHVTFDNSQDKFGGPKKGKQTFTCGKIAEFQQSNGIMYELQNCTGHNDQLGDTLYLLRVPNKK